MQKVIIMRHGEAESHASNDASRQLTDDGREEVRSSALTLNNTCPQIDRMIVSPYARARQTADIVAEQFGGIPEFVSDKLTPDRSPEDVLSVIEDYLVDVDTGLLVFHQPIASRTVRYLTGQNISMRTAGVAVLEIGILGRETCELKCVL